MAGADSTVRVNIVGDAKSLQAATATADKSLSGLGASAKGLLAGAAFAGATAAVLDFGAAALNEGDRVGDALTRLEGQLSDDLVGAIDDAADEMSDLGQSRQDVLELSAAFTDVATALGIADPLIADFAPKAAEVAAAMALISDLDPATVVDLIGKAAGGSEKALKTLGIDLDEAAVQAAALEESGKDTPDLLTDSEVAAGKYAVILETLSDRLQPVIEGTGDFEQRTATLQAKWETLMGKLGEGADGPLTDILTVTLDYVEVLEETVGLLDKSPKVFDAYGDAAQKQLGPLGSIVDVLGDIAEGIGIINRTPVTVKYSSTPNPDRRDSFDAAVIQAIKDYGRRNGLTIL